MQQVTLRAPTLDDAEMLFERAGPTRCLATCRGARIQTSTKPVHIIAEIFNVGGETTSLSNCGTGPGRSGSAAGGGQRPHIIDFGYCLGRRWWRRASCPRWSLLYSTTSATHRLPGDALHVDEHGVGATAGKQRPGLEGRLARYAVLPNITATNRSCFGKAIK